MANHLEKVLAKSVTSKRSPKVNNHSQITRILKLKGVTIKIAEGIIAKYI